MADDIAQRITALPELTVVDVTDLLAIVDDPAGSPVTKKITVANLLVGIGGTDLVLASPATLRVLTGADASLSSTLHGFQIGPTSGVNMRIDPNEIMTINNGVVNGMLMQAAGGNIVFFSSAPSVFQLFLGSGGELVWQNPDNTVAMTQAGDGTDFNSVFDAVTDWNVSGITNIVMPDSGSGIRLESTIDVSLSSTAHPFQIGVSSGPNLRMDTNEIMSVNNGAVDGLNIQTDGGSIALWGAVDAGAYALFIDGGGHVIWQDVTNTDQADFFHDDIDFNSVFVTTANWNISGIAAIQAGTVDADFDALSSVSLAIADTLPLFSMQDTDAALNEKNWLFRVTAGDLTISTALDATPFIQGPQAISMIRGTGNAFSNFQLGGPIVMQEIASAVADVTAFGQFWVRDDDPNTPMFTGDTGIDSALARLDIAQIVSGVWSHEHASFGQFAIDRLSATGDAAIQYRNNDGIKGYIGVNDFGTLELWNASAGSSGFQVTATGQILGKTIRPEITTTAALDDKVNAINTSVNKNDGAAVHNTTTGIWVIAQGNADTSVWFDFAGNTAHTPV